MTGLDDAVRRATRVPVLDGVAAAVVLAEGIVRQGLRASKVRSYAAPRLKHVKEWPLSGGPRPPP